MKPINLVPQGSVVVPRELILSADLRLAEKATYVGLLLQPHGSIGALSRRLSVGRDSISANVRQLERAGWATRSSGYLVWPSYPRVVSGRKIEWLKTKLTMKPHIGETLSFSWLDELIDSTEYVEHARPPFLRSPVTGAFLEYDRLYPNHKKAFEHEGLQHFGPTEKYPDAKEFRMRQLRDLAKIGLSIEQGIELVPITWKDLSYAGMLSKIPDGLPKRNVDPEDPYILYLEGESAKYRERMQEIVMENFEITD